MPEISPSENLSIPLLVSTRNLHKVDEIRAILGSHFTVFDLSSVPSVPVVEETGSTFEDNATLKAIAASLAFEGWVIADDSGLEVDALKGAPGVYSARYAGEDSTDALNNRKLLAEIAGSADRSARFRCVIVLARAGRKLAAFSGTVEGHILEEPMGEGGFGYDPLFVPQGFTESFGQLPSDVKNSLSHRSRALQKLRDWKGWF